MLGSTLVGQIVRGQAETDRMKGEITVVIGALAFQAIDKEDSESNYLTLVEWSVRNTEYEWRLFPKARSVALLTGAVGVRVPLYQYQSRSNEPPLLKLKHVARVHGLLGEFVDAILRRHPKFREEIVEPLIRAAQSNLQQ